jgi:hypothetical protein
VAVMFDVCSPLGDAQTLHYNRGTTGTSSSSARKAMLACVIALAPCSGAGRSSHEGSTGLRARHEKRLALCIVGCRVHRYANSFKTARNHTASTCCGREAMQGAERRLAVSVAPETPWLPPRSLGKRRLFFGRIASGGVWSSPENGAL